jgi:uncharacterized membrane protein YedE/YeeE
MLFSEPYSLIGFNFLIGAAVGNIFYRSDYCMSGMFRDIFLLRSASLLRSLFFMASASMFFFFILRKAGIINNYPPPSYGHTSMATLAGGLVFGVGMVLAGGCVVGTLYKLAKGNIANTAAFLGIIAGSLIYAEIHPFVDDLRKDTVIIKTVLIPQSFPALEPVIIAVLSASAVMLYIKWKKNGLLSYNAYADGYINPLKTALILAALNTAVYAFSGWPMGITTAYAKLGAYIENAAAPSHAMSLSYFNEASFSVMTNGLRMEGGAGPRTDLISFTELPFLFGIIVGSFLTALYLREFKIYGIPPLRQLFSAIAGGIMLGLGARIAGGCNLKFVVGGLPLLSYQALAFVISMSVGAYLGTILLRRVVLKI